MRGDHAEIWIEVSDPGDRKSFARLSFYDEEDDQGNLKTRMNDPEVIGCKSTIECALKRIAFFINQRKENHER
jgi:hypothetical protein